MKRALARLASSTTLHPASCISRAQSRPTNSGPTISDEDMAWLLADAVTSGLTGYERTLVFIELGCGEGYLAIKRILTTLLSNPIPLPVSIFSKLAVWLNSYAGNPEESQLRMMLDVIRLQQFKAV
ncbi:tryptophanase [Mycobacterium sp. E2989]|uniref:tryptophanase n=1 Tax=Mycobacterium sp. E2989 TaxID=1834140 RepID=UPI001E460CE3|nr:tryptophanase [Mycobacterium sp. E2989]